MVACIVDFVLGLNELFCRIHQATKCYTAEYGPIIDLHMVDEPTAIIIERGVVGRLQPRRFSSHFRYQLFEHGVDEKGLQVDCSRGGHFSLALEIVGIAGTQILTSSDTRRPAISRV